jgi:hypothetical protein
MAAPNHNYRFRRAARNPVPPAHRLKHRLENYFHEHPQVTREDFLLAALEKEMDSRTADTVLRTWAANARPLPRGSSRWQAARGPRTTSDTRLHAWLAERVLVLDRRRNSWREKLRYVLSRNPMITWIRRQVGTFST